MCSLVTSYCSCNFLMMTIRYVHNITIYRYIAIFIGAIQYNTPDKNCILQYITTVIAFKVISIQLLHYKYDWTSRNHEYSV